jgi:anti-anti-sigma factor
VAELEIDRRLVGDAAMDRPLRAVLRCAGEIDLGNVSQLAQSLRAEIESGICEVEVDLQEVQYLDTAGIAAFLTAHRALRGQGRTLSVRARRHVLAVLRRIGLDQIVSVHPPDVGES